MSRQVPPSNSPSRSGSHGRNSYTGRCGHGTDQNASTSKALSNQHRPLTAKLKSLGLKSDSILYSIAKRIDKFDLWSTNVGRRWENRHSGGSGDGRSYGRERRSGSVGVSDRQRQGQRDQNRASLGEGRRKSLQHGQEGRVSSAKSNNQTGRHPSSGRRVTAVKSYVNDPDSSDTSHDSGAARFRTKMGIETPPRSFPLSVQRQTDHCPRSDDHGPTSIIGRGRDASRLETTQARPLSIGTSTTLGRNNRRENPARQSPSVAASLQPKQGQDRSGTRKEMNDAKLPWRRRRTKHDRSGLSHISVSPLLYGR